MDKIEVRVRLDGEKWWVWVNDSRFMGFKSEGDAVGVNRRIADVISAILPKDSKVTYSQVRPQAQGAQPLAKKAGA